MGKIYLFVLLIGLCSTLAQAQRPGRPEGQQRTRGPHGTQSAEAGARGSNENNNGSNESNERGSRGQEEEYERLCQSGDMDCLGNLFTQNSQCTPVTHGNDPIALNLLVTYVPRFNLTIFCNNVELTYISVKILSVDLEKVTNTLVITIESVVYLDAPNTDWYFERVGKIDRHVNDFVTCTYSQILTAKIPWSRQISMQGVEVTPYVTDPYPPFQLGPKFSDSSDPLIRRTYEAILTDIPTCIIDLMRTNSYYFFFTYVQNYICDFGYQYNGLIWS